MKKITTTFASLFLCLFISCISENTDDESLVELLKKDTRINQYNIVKTDYLIEASAQSGIDYKLGAGVNMNNPSHPKGGLIQVLDFEDVKNNDEIVKTSELTKQTSYFLDIKNSYEYSKVVKASLGASYQLSSFNASFERTKKIEKEGYATLIIFENLITKNVKIREEDLNWKNPPQTENTADIIQRRSDFIQRYGSHFIRKIDYGYKIVIDAKINSKVQTEIEKIKADLDLSFGSIGSTASFQQDLKVKETNNKLEITCVIMAGRVIGENGKKEPIVIKTIDGIEDFFDRLRNGKINIVYGPRNVHLNSYSLTLDEYPKSKEIFYSGPYQPSSPFGVPRGTIIMWNPPPNVNVVDPDINNKWIPQGWGICDGNNGTPNLIDRFVMGRNINDKMEDLEGGSSSHNHSGTTTASNNRKEHGNRSSKDASDRLHKHSFTTSQSSNLPPFYKLIYLMKL